MDVVGVAAHADAPDDGARHLAALRAVGVDALRVVVGDREVLRGDALRCYAAARFRGADASLEVVPEMFHDFMLFPKFLKEAKATLASSGAWVRSIAEAPPGA